MTASIIDISSLYACDSVAIATAASASPVAAEAIADLASGNGKNRSYIASH